MRFAGLAASRAGHGGLMWLAATVPYSPTQQGGVRRPGLWALICRIASGEILVQVIKQWCFALVIFQETGETPQIMYVTMPTCYRDRVAAPAGNPFVPDGERFDSSQSNTNYQGNKYSLRHQCWGWLKSF